ncbi:glycosyltransferase family 4 protein [bacterium]|nr:glycosyltransferase family 4 protein [bacterium]
MRIAYIASGAGNMYCGSCLHDNALAAALMKLGHEVALVPTYTPIRTDEESVSMDHVFYGGINVYLQQKSSLFRHTPSALDELLNSRGLLKFISRYTSSTDARELGPLTVSVLQGEEGNQRKELQKLIEWLKDSYKPELIHLTNAMFVGFARDMKKALNVPVLCSLQGEDIFLEDLVEPYKSKALQVLRERAGDIDGFISTSQYYADFMKDYLDIPDSKIDTVRLGLNLKGHGEQTKSLPAEPFVIGYLARICPEKGLHVLVDAFDLLIKEGVPARLKVAGYLGKRDEKYFHGLLQKITDRGWKDRFEYIGEIDRPEKIQFLNTLHVLSVPTVYREPKGLYILEALANGVPVVQPSHGAFPELIEATRGGILVDPQSPQSLAKGLHSLFKNPGLREELGRNGKDAVHHSFGDRDMAEATLQVYNRYVVAV